MEYREAVEAFAPRNGEEAADRAAALDCIAHYGEEVLWRNPIAHLTASAFVLNPKRNKALMLRHNLLGKWAWPGGHADGDTDLAATALREAREETGAEGFAFLSLHMVSLEVLPVPTHWRRGVYVSNHLHLNASYLLALGEDAPLSIKPDENQALAWFPRSAFNLKNFSPEDVKLYNKLFERALEI